MKLVHAPDYAIRTALSSTSETVPISEVIVAGMPTGRFVSGAVFETALRWNEYVLLFLTDGVPFEDTLNIYLLDASLNVVDYARMYFIYSTGIFSDLDLTEPDTVRFRFFGDIVWTLRLLRKKAFAFPIICTPRGVHRPFKLSRMFQIDGAPFTDGP